MARTSKADLKQALLAALEVTLGGLERSHADTRAGATHAEAKPENDKDTRALEASYLARGQAMRIEELRLALAEVRAMSVEPTKQGATLGSLVTALEDEQSVRFFLAPQGGGTKLPGGVQVVTPRSPLGVALLGKRAGDACELKLGGRDRELEVTRVE
jgi:transcription elongation GreA/GreB family factor